MRKTSLLITVALAITFFCVRADAANRRTPVVEAVEKAGAAIVNISTTTIEKYNPFRGKNPLEDFFGEGFFPDRAVRKESLGSGVIIRPDGFILTNNHVIAGATEIKVTLVDEREFPAEVIGADAGSDLAVIKVNTKDNLPVVPIGRSDDLMIGETIIAIGNPFGLAHTVTTGVISAVGRDIEGEDGKLYQDFIQTDASINPGNSGGALLNINGELIGVTSAIYRAAEGIGFAIPVDKAKRIVEDLINYGVVHRGWIGFFVSDLTPDIGRKLGWRDKGGALVTRVFSEGPAQQVGLRPGDIVVTVGGKKVQDRREFEGRVASYTEGDTVSVGVFRKGETREIGVRPVKLSPEVADLIAVEWLGIRVKERGGKGVVISSISRNGELGKIGVTEGDVIRKINRAPTDSVDGFRKAVMEAQGSGSAVVFLQRGAVIYQIVIGK